MSAHGVEEFATELRRLLATAASRLLNYVNVNAGELRRPIGGYPGAHHRMPAAAALDRAMVTADGPLSGRIALAIKVLAGRGERAGDGTDSAS